MQFEVHFGLKRVLYSVGGAGDRKAPVGDRGPRCRSLLFLNAVLPFPGEIAGAL